MRIISFTSIAVQPQNEEQTNRMAQIAYKAKEIIGRRYGSGVPTLIKANISGDTVVFSAPETSAAGQRSFDSIMQRYLRGANIPFKQVQ